MKRFHLHVSVKNLNESIQFYSTLFGQAPAKIKEDYAKWMLEDPRINFAISTKNDKVGIDHLGIQVDEEQELRELTSRLKNAEVGVYDEGFATCCYAKSNKAWVIDPSGIAWEAYQTMEDVELFSEKSKDKELTTNACCTPSSNKSKSSCC